LLERREVATDVEGEAVHGYPVAHAHADGGDFAVGDPGAGEALAAARGYAEGGADADEELLQGAQVAVKILAVIAKIEDGIAYELAGTVVGGLAAAIDLDERMGKMGGATQAGLVRGAADGVNGVVLEEEELIGDGAVATFGYEAILEGEALLEIDAAQPLDGDSWGGWRCGRHELPIHGLGPLCRARRNRGPGNG